MTGSQSRRGATKNKILEAKRDAKAKKEAFVKFCGECRNTFHSEESYNVHEPCKKPGPVIPNPTKEVMKDTGKEEEEVKTVTR